MFAVRLYRFYRYLFLLRVPFFPWLFKTINRVIFATVLPPSATLGRSVVLSYEGLGTVIHKRAVIGDRTIIGTGVTIGGRSGSEAVPVIGEGVLIGSGAKILGAVKIGNYSSIGANSVVLTDIPDFAVAVGIPARVVKINKPEDIPDYFSFKKKQ